jgi:hypothetical protein
LKSEINFQLTKIAKHDKRCLISCQLLLELTIIINKEGAMNHMKIALIIFLPLLLSPGCQESDDANITTDQGGTLEMELVTSNATSAKLAQAVGQATATNLSSLKYFIQNITICQELTVNGSGYSGKSGCLVLYSSENTPDYDTYLAPEASADTTNYIDLVSAEGKAKLKKSTTLTSSDVGSYYWGVIDWYRPIKVTAQVTLNDNTSLFTKTGTTVLESGTGIGATYVTQITGSATEPAEESIDATEPAEESIVVLPNGGNWFRFQEPFEITQADITDQTAFSLKLVFNPEGIIKGYTNSTRTGVGIHDTVTDAVIHVPMLDLAPVAHKVGDSVKKESYLLKYTGNDITPLNIRLELYYLASDAEKTIYAVEGKYIYTADSTGELGDFYKTSYVETTTGVTQFQDWDRKAFVTDFTRLSIAGETGTAKLNCESSYGFGSCTTSTLDVTTDLVSVSTVE